MLIEVQAMVTYTVELTDEDVELIKERVKEKADDCFPIDKEDIIAAAEELWSENKISLYDEGKATESEFSTESFGWSEFEDMEPEDLVK